MPETRTVVLTTGTAEYAAQQLDEIPGAEIVKRYELSSAHADGALARGLAEAGAWAVVAGSEPYTREVFDKTPELEAILRWGTGSDAVDIAAATDAGVAVVTTPTVNAEAVADLALALMLACLRRLRELDAAVRDAEWRPGAPTRDLAGATVGIVALGAIGKAVTRRVRGFGCHVIAVEPHPDAEFCSKYGVELATLEDMLPRVDVLTLHAPATSATRHLISAPQLEALPRHAVLVNTARGDLVDQPALVDALHNGQIAGAGLDVFEHEPVKPDDPILSAPNTVLSGHLASFTALGLSRTGDAVVANLRELLAGQLPASTLNPEAWGAR